MKRTNKQHGFDFSCGNATSKNLLYQHMSNHYRRILTAKKAVDTSPPRRCRPTASPCPKDEAGSPRSSSCSDSFFFPRQRPHCSASLSSMTRADMNIIDRITFDTKYAPHTYSSVDWNTIQARKKSEKALMEVYGSSKSRKRNTTVTNSRNKPLGKCQLKTGPFPPSYYERQKVADIMDAHSEHFQARGGEFQPRILKTEASSKVKNLQVYHPPRRKTTWVEEEDEEEDQKPSTSQVRCKCKEICVCGCRCREAVQSQSQTSSRDSAYNGGAPSVPESRSPTPDCRKGEVLEHRIREEEKKKIEGYKDEKLRNLRDDALYTKLIDDITTEVLAKGLYTNQSLRKIIRRHMVANSDKLNETRMLKEVEQLRIQLGIPDDDTLKEIPLTMSGSSEHLLREIPLLLDSQLELVDTTLYPSDYSKTRKPSLKTQGEETDVKRNVNFSRAVDVIPVTEEDNRSNISAVSTPQNNSSADGSK